MEKHVFELASGLLDRNVEVQILCEDRSFLPDPKDELRDHTLGVAPESLRSRGWVQRYSEKSRRFAEMLEPARYDIVHCHSHYGFAIASKLSRLRRRPGLVTTFHLTPFGQLERFRHLDIPEPEGAPIDRAVAEMEATCARLSDRCVAVSRGVRHEVVTFYGVPEERVRAIYNWYSPRNFEPYARQRARQLLHLNPNGAYLLYVGHFELHRGRLLAEVMRHLPPEITLLVIHPETDERIQAEFGHRVQFVGYLSPDRMGLYYAACDLQCFPAVYSGFGLVLPEGMACGCPPVVFNFSAMNEIVTPESGYLVDSPTADAYARAVLQGLHDGGRKSAAAICRAQEFRMEPQIDRVLDLYHEVLTEVTREGRLE